MNLRQAWLQSGVLKGAGFAEEKKACEGFVHIDSMKLLKGPRWSLARILRAVAKRGVTELVCKLLIEPLMLLQCIVAFLQNNPEGCTCSLAIVGSKMGVFIVSLSPCLMNSKTYTYLLIFLADAFCVWLSRRKNCRLISLFPRKTLYSKWQQVAGKEATLCSPRGFPCAAQFHSEE